MKKRIESVASTLYFQVYEETFGGKSRGKFRVDREDLKSLLGVRRLHAITIQKLADACLRLGLVMIDLDTYFAFAETQFVENWRKLPERICQNYLENLEEDADVDADDDDDNDEDDEDI